MSELPIDMLNPQVDVASGQHMVEETVFSVSNNAAEDKIPGGLADNKSVSDFDIKALRKGIKVELEHTDDREIAKEIAMDHLTEDPLYYDMLEEMESHASVLKEGMGLLDIPASIGGGEVLDFQGIPQNPGLSREQGDGEETDFFGAAEEDVDLPPENNKVQAPFGEERNTGELEKMFEELRKLEAFLNKQGKKDKAEYIRLAFGTPEIVGGYGGLVTPFLWPPAVFIPPPLRAYVGGRSARILTDYLNSNPDKKSALEEQKAVVEDLEGKIKYYGVTPEHLTKLSSREINPGDLSLHMEKVNTGWFQSHPAAVLEVQKLAQQYLVESDKLVAMTQTSIADMESSSSVETSPSGISDSRYETSPNEPSELDRGRRSTTYRFPDEDADVRAIQTLIGTSPDGAWGKLTDSAWSNYLVENGLPPKDPSSLNSASEALSYAKGEAATEDVSAEDEEEYLSVTLSGGPFKGTVSGQVISRSNEGTTVRFSDGTEGLLGYSDLESTTSITKEEFEASTPPVTSEPEMTEPLAKEAPDNIGNGERVNISAEKQSELFDYYKNQTDSIEEAKRMYYEKIEDIKAGGYDVIKESEGDGGRRIAVLDLGDEFPTNIRYDGIYYGQDDSGENAWVTGGLSRAEVRALGFDRGTGERREMGRERRQEGRDNRSDRKTKRQTDRVNKRPSQADDERAARKDSARKESRRMFIEGLHKIATEG